MISTALITLLLRGNVDVTVFPDPIPKEVDEKDVEKPPHNIPFPPTANSAKNVSFTIKCEECQKHRLLHSKYKMKGDLKGAKRMMAMLSYVCGSIISEYMGTGADRDEKYLTTIFVRENLSCASKIERKESQRKIVCENDLNNNKKSK